MARLLLRGAPLADVQVVLFDKDGTLSRSEPQLLVLAKARIEACLDALLRLHPERSGAGPELSSLLHRAYGLQEPAAAPLAPPGLRPCGATAVGSRQHTLISTATALAQVGLGWPEALAIAESVFNATDPLHHGPLAAPTGTTAVGPMLERLAAAGLTLAVISNDNAAGIHHFLASLGVAQLFHSQLWSADDHPCKPHPDAVHGLCRRLGTEARHCALIGDANSDLHMARQAGVAAVIGYRSGWSQVPSLDPRYPQLNHWDELSVALATGGTDHR
ncbi:MAG: HAD family hydrolase [Prochlorococcaceae cyanobacterium]